MNIPGSTPSIPVGAVEPPPVTDTELVFRCQRGEMAAFEELVNRYRGKIYSLAYGMARNEQDAHDLCQETFVRAWHSIDKFRGQSSFYTWLYRIVTNLTIDLMRKKSRAPQVAFDERLDVTGAAEGELSEATHNRLPSDDAHFKEIRQSIDRALEQLSPDHRAVILLKDFEGLEYKEIAKVVGCSPGTVMSRLFYARRHLQKLLKGAL